MTFGAKTEFALNISQSLPIGPTGAIKVLDWLACIQEFSHEDRS
jgi:hypothetical protein